MQRFGNSERTVINDGLNLPHSVSPIQLVGFGQSGRMTSLVDPTSGVAYQVPADKVLVVDAIQVWDYTATGVPRGTILYCDNSIGINSATAPTNPVYEGSTDSFQVCGGNGDLGPLSYPTNFTIPASKYPTYTCRSDGNTGVRIFAHLEDA